MRGCKAALVSAALGCGSVHAAYLPVVGPAPLRFQYSLASAKYKPSTPLTGSPTAKTSPKSPDASAAAPAPGQPLATDSNPSPAPFAQLAFNELTPWEQAAASIWSPDAPPPMFEFRPQTQPIPDAVQLSSVVQQPALVTPQSLLPFFAPRPGPVSDASTVPSIPVEFTPPRRPPSSTAVYNKQ